MAEILKIREITIDTMQHKDFNVKEEELKLIRFYQNDLNSAKLLINVTHDKVVTDFSSATSVQIAFLKPDCKRVFQDVQNVNQMQGKYYVVLSTQTLIAYGKVIAQLRFTFPNNKVIETCKFAFTVDESIMSDDAMKSTNEFPVIQKAIEAGKKLEGVDIDGIIAAGAKADAALPKTGGTMTGNLTFQSDTEANIPFRTKTTNQEYVKFYANPTRSRLGVYSTKNSKNVWDYDGDTDSFNVNTNTNLLKKTDTYTDLVQPNGNTKTLAVNTDLNTITTPGTYAGSKLVNAPDVDLYFYIEVSRYSDTKYAMQRATTLTGNSNIMGTWVRRMENNAWRPWERLIDSKGGTMTGYLNIQIPGAGDNGLVFKTTSGADIHRWIGTNSGAVAWQDKLNNTDVFNYSSGLKTWTMLNNITFNVNGNTNLMKKTGDTATGHMIFRHNINQETADGLKGVNMVVNSSVNKWSVAPKMDGNPVWANEFAMDLNTGKVTVPSLGTKKDGRANISITADGELISGNGVIADRRGNTVTLRAGIRRKVGIPHTNAIFTLPVDMRPLLTVQQNTISTDGTPCLITIQTNGEFSIQNVGSNNAQGKDYYVTISYVVD
ncbi:BppU family phage baseplate upper protein [Bacillus cereus]